MKNKKEITKEAECKFKLCQYGFWAVPLIIILCFLTFHRFFYLPAMNAYEKINSSTIHAIFTLAGMTANCEGMKILYKNDKEKEAFYKEEIASHNVELFQDQIKLYTSLTLSKSYLDKETAAKLKNFLEKVKAYQQTIVISDSCPQIDTSYDKLMDWKHGLTQNLPYTFFEYLSFYIKNNFLKT